MIIIAQIALGESKTLELKRELPSAEHIAKTVIAFANTSGGKLVIGVDDERKIVTMGPWVKQIKSSYFNHGVGT